MSMALVIMVLTLAIILVFGTKIAAIFGFVVACATFSFPLGLIGLVGIGVSLLFLLNPRIETD